MLERKIMCHNKLAEVTSIYYLRVNKKQQNNNT